MQRLIDIIFSIIAIFILFIPILIIGILIKMSSKGPILYWSDRVGYKNDIFSMPKFRTMKIQTPELATNDLPNPETYITKIGYYLRRYSLDEIPQIICLITGKMTLIGPRPALFNQNDLIMLRTNNKIHMLRPGITGYAQVNGRDQLSIEEKVNLEIYYKQNKSFFLDIKIIILTVIKVFIKEGVSH
tara:strand:+ start:2014 stop:2574 length:561 start_codon:yes stop_codon:yes gene_type:complete